MRGVNSTLMNLADDSKLGGVLEHGRAERINTNRPREIRKQASRLERGCVDRGKLVHLDIKCNSYHSQAHEAVII